MSWRKASFTFPAAQFSATETPPQVTFVAGVVEYEPKDTGVSVFALF
jgi:hypothetical protein